MQLHVYFTEISRIKFRGEKNPQNPRKLEPLKFSGYTALIT